MTKLRVLHLVNTLSAGGAELHLLALCRAQREASIDPVVACLRENVVGSVSLRGRFEALGIPVLRLCADNRIDWRFVAKLPRLIREQRIDLVHTHLPRADIGAMAVRRMLGVPVVASVHGLYCDRWFGRMARPAMAFAYRSADAVIAISGRVADWLCDDLGLPPSRVHRIHYGIDPTPFRRALEAGSASGFVIGSVGRLEPGKGFETLIQALPLVRDAIPTARLRIAGHDPLGHGPRLTELARSLGLADGAVELVGFVGDVPRFLSEIDVFAFASTSEGFGQVVIEAMAAERPMVVSNIAPLTEIVVAGTTGVLAAPGDAGAFGRAIRSLLERPSWARTMAAEGARRVETTFTIDVMLERTVSVYRGLGVNGPRVRAAATEAATAVG
jgi:glycosyltransferase involved in cell wall biosynthesis